MKKIIFSVILLASAVSVIIYFTAFNGNSVSEVKKETMQTIKLPEPQKSGGMPLMEALSKRKSSREFSSRKLDLQTLSNLLWAGDGINRKESGKRTAPTANDTRAMDIYAITEEGVYIYDAENHSLELISDRDLRELTGKQDFVKTAPLNLVYVEDYAKHKSQEDKEMIGGSHAGFIAQNVYLYCASTGLNTVIRGWIDKGRLKKELGLRDSQDIILAQTVGYPE